MQFGITDHRITTTRLSNSNITDSGSNQDDLGYNMGFASEPDFGEIKKVSLQCGNSKLQMIVGYAMKPM